MMMTKSRDIDLHFYTFEFCLLKLTILKTSLGQRGSILYIELHPQLSQRPTMKTSRSISSSTMPPTPASWAVLKPLPVATSTWLP